MILYVLDAVCQHHKPPVDFIQFAPLKAVAQLFAPQAQRMKTTGFFQGSWAWELAGGGGVDYRWRGPFDFRAQADYIRTNFFNDAQNNFRGAIGIVIRF